jgi:sugar lactone lactonase YvrE
MVIQATVNGVGHRSAHDFALPELEDTRPMLSPDFEIIHPRMNQCVLGNVFVEKLFSGMRWAEGPVWFGDSRSLIWSDIPNNKMMRWFESGHVEVFRDPLHHGYDIALFGVRGTTRCIRAVRKLKWTFVLMTKCWS